MSFGLISSAYAQATSGQTAPGGLDMLQQFVPLIFIVVIFYFLLFRPQQQKAKQLRNQLSQLRRGDGVVTAGGIIGTVARVISDDELAVDIAEGVRVRVVRSTITGVVSKSEAANDGGKGSSSDGEVETKPAGRRKTPAGS
ncbi:MAG TPA: preprotein translocase subunit YajC [Alphaproteobacteria bacterium]|nr:preprotein translocase subunit YajC [Alphaproteobacteria bacterium]